MAKAHGLVAAAVSLLLCVTIGWLTIVVVIIIVDSREPAQHRYYYILHIGRCFFSKSHRRGLLHIEPNRKVVVVTSCLFLFGRKFLC